VFNISFKWKKLLSDAHAPGHTVVETGRCTHRERDTHLHTHNTQHTHTYTHTHTQHPHTYTHTHAVTVQHNINIFHILIISWLFITKQPIHQFYPTSNVLNKNKNKNKNKYKIDIDC
jgi:hypothetical protein